MIISALDRYYDCLANMENSSLLPENRSRVKISYIISLSEDGELVDIIPHFKTVEIRGKEKEVPIEEVLPKILDVPVTRANYLEHRSKYIFGFKANKDEYEITKNSQKSFDSFKEKSKFLNEIDSPLAKAIANFAEKWNPNEEKENPILMKIVKDFNTSHMNFCLQNNITSYSFKDKKIIDKIDELLEKDKKSDGEFGFCAISGKYLPIARIHDKLKGVYGGLGSGVKIISAESDSCESYSLKKGNISSISEQVMKKYTTALNYLIKSEINHYILGDMTLLFWAETSQNADDYVNMFAFANGFYRNPDIISENIKNSIFELSKGKMPDIKALYLDENTKFYILGVKPNASRLAIKFFEFNSFGNMLENVAKHLQGIRLYDDQSRIPSIYNILNETVSPKTKEKPNPALQSAFILSVLNYTMYPSNLLGSLVTRIKTDQDTDKSRYIKINDTRVGMIKGYINRKINFIGGEKITMALNTQSRNTAYLCGRLFAILEKLQKDSIGNVNAGIKAKYFGSACSTPAMVFPRLIKLAQNHISKLNNGNGFYLERKMSEILNMFEGDFPSKLSIEEQGRFILGYYQQNKDLYTKQEDKLND